MKTIAIIPVRYGSTRLPGKPLALIGGKPMMQHVYERVGHAVEEVAIACDDSRIVRAAEAFGAETVLTSTDIRTGTDRVSAAAGVLLADRRDADDYIVVNVQGDEPFIAPADISRLVQAFDDPDVQIATLATRFDPAEGFDALFNPNNVKVAIDLRGDALYFSRAILPYVRNVKWQDWVDSADFYIHTGIYAYRYPTLMHISGLKPTPLETAESLEQLRWLQNGLKIRVIVTGNATLGVDTPEDLAKANEIWNSLTD